MRYSMVRFSAVSLLVSFLFVSGRAADPGPGVSEGTSSLAGGVLRYQDGDMALEGYLAYDPRIAGRRPGVIVVHDWMGLGDFARHEADELARLGYVAFAADIYGQGVRPKDAKEASDLAGYFKSHRDIMRRRAWEALKILRQQPQTDPSRLAAIGFCFGGTTALELARSGAPLAGVVSFHGGLDTPRPEDARNIKGKVLALHGADDPFVTPEQVVAFEKEMRDAHVDWQLVKYGGAVHAFTIPSAGTDNSKGAAYNEKAAQRSWQAMKDFFGEIFAR